MSETEARSPSPSTIPPDLRRSRSPASFALLALVVGSAALLAVPLAGATGLPPATGGGFSCKVVFGSTPDALMIAGTGPNGTLGAGGSVGYQYEFQVQNFTASLKGHTVYLPSATVAFTTTTGTIQPFDLQHTITIANGSWSSPTASAASHTVTSSVAFKSGTTPTLSTQKLAVMVDAGYGKIQLAFRWHWTVTYPNGTHAAGAWTVPTTSGLHPSIFYGAPYVKVVSHTASPVTLGTNYTATLSGGISKEPFFLELEFASSGHVVNSHGATAPAGNTTPFPATIPFNSYTHDLQPATMLVHVHNHCGSMLASISATGVYASSATVTIVSNVAACSGLTFNGASYASGSQITVKPSHTSVPIVAPACAGHTFTNWTSTPALRIITASHASTSVIVTYTGTLEAHYA